MKNILNKVLEAIVAITSTLILGSFIPTILIIFISASSTLKFEDCVTHPMYWFFSLIGWFISMFYINEAINRK